MNGSDWGNILAAFGPVGGLAIGLVYVLARSGFLSRDGHDDSKIDRMNEKLSEVRDRLISLEATQREMSRRLDRLDR